MGGRVTRSNVLASFTASNSPLITRPELSGRLSDPRACRIRLRTFFYMGFIIAFRHRPLLRLPLIVAASMLGLCSLTGCTAIVRELSKSDVTAEELSSTLLRASDLPGWSVMTETENAAAANFQERLGEVCDIDASQSSSTYFSPEEDLTTSSTAEPVCGGWKAAREATVAAEATYRQVVQDSLAAGLSEAGLGLSDFRYERVDLGLGEQSLVYAGTATLRGPGGTISYELYMVSQFSDYLATTVLMEGYDRPVDRNELLRLASIVKGRMVSLG
jgi:hypothetical protein